MLHLECSPDSRINVTDAMYGRQNRVTCPHDEMTDINCNYDKSLEWVQERCQDNTICSVSHPNTDPCVNTYKYLEVTYVCVSKYDLLHSEYTDWLLCHLLVCSISATTFAVEKIKESFLNNYFNTRKALQNGYSVRGECI